MSESLHAHDATGLPELGSRWYIGGAHWEVVAHTEREGEPAVRCRSLKKNSRVHLTWVWRLAARRALPSGAVAAETNGRLSAAGQEPTTTKGGADMAKELTKKNAELAAAATAPIADGKPEDVAVWINRYGEQWTRYKTGVRSSAPPNLGLDKETVTAIREAVEAALAA